MKKYLDIVQDVLDNGQKVPNRTGIDALAIPNAHFSHNFGTKEGNVCHNFPLLTTKKIATKALSIELEGFIGGITDKKWYQAQGCKIWNEWANPLETFTNMMRLGYLVNDEAGKKEVQAATQDLGPIYGFQWRRFGAYYEDGNPINTKLEPLIKDSSDQLARLIKMLKTNPNDRRLVCSAWNPKDLDRMALPPCHLCFVVTVINDTLSLHWTQRSCDLMLGVPFNIASYGMLMCLLCHHAGLKPGNLSGMLCNCHIYENHIDGAKEQLAREPRSLPSLQISQDSDSFNLFEWTHQDVQFLDYNPHSTIKLEVAI